MSKKLLAVLLILIIAAEAFAGCARWLPNHGAEATYGPILLSEEAETEEPVTAEPTDEATEEPTAEPTEEATEGPDATEPAATPESGASAEPTQPAGNYDYSVFADCAFVGNSVFAGLYAYAVITNSRFYAKVGLNVVTIYTATMNASSTVPVIDELYEGSYKGILLMFGTNECAWPSVDTVLEKYEQLLRDIWVRQPDSTLFISGVPPVCKFVDESTDNDIKNETIVYINEQLEQMAERYDKAYFIPVPDFMINEEGALPDDASAGDGIHFNLTYYKKWADHLCRYVSAVLD